MRASWPSSFTFQRVCLFKLKVVKIQADNRAHYGSRCVPLCPACHTQAPGADLASWDVLLFSACAPNTTHLELQYRGQLDLARHWRYPFLFAVPRKRLFCDLNHPIMLQDLDIARHGAPVAL